MRIYTDLPIELGQEWRYKTVDNFKNILDGFNAMDKNFEYHKTEESHAHKAKQIDYKLLQHHGEF